MLKQLADLSINVDGRYATDSELQPIEEIFEDIEVRISAYEKIRDAEAQILEQLQKKIKSKKENIFSHEGRDVTGIWQRDIQIILRYSLAAILTNDLDRLRQGLLLWARTIMNVNNVLHIGDLTYEVMPEVLKKYVNDEEMKLIQPALQLVRFTVYS